MRRVPSKNVSTRECSRAYAAGGSGLSPLAQIRGRSGVMSIFAVPTLSLMGLDCAARGAAAASCRNSLRPSCADMRLSIRPHARSTAAGADLQSAKDLLATLRVDARDVYEDAVALVISVIRFFI